ncbi:PIR protein [Plasmodium yoelii]|uniref:PIR protein n=3 Tax=Plasmodium yoelii TaxID=5861 RepID=A0AAE9WJ71_PLAYO|nr:PIR protein [Plasmodium yoelii]WBY54862.1 PIR protein [Plasmodium yoelii yoelii]WBY58959.1 PIR protein [Plasmodium yoelii yoelii]VTZ71870.1 PIR protein [Plasmodium yoelii]|eukprot:XP_034493351.1 PIR protein [Plasmodium yoelii]
MAEFMCERLNNVWIDFPDTLTNGNYKFNGDELFNSYCNNNCKTELDKVNGICLWLFEKSFGNNSSFVNNAQSNINIVEYIIIWLSYMLSLKSHEEITNINDFYDKYIKNGEKYIKEINDVNDYKSYKDLIDKKQYLMNINKNVISKFYNALKSLCNMYNEFNDDDPDCKTYSEKAKEFIEKYKELNEDNNNTKDSPYNQILSTLSNDYNILKSKCNSDKSINFPSLPTFSRRSVIKSTLTSITFIFVAVSILLGISYKYSLFGFRKRSQKQHLRKKLKK